MQEFLVLIKTEGDRSATQTPEQHRQHVEKVSKYIARLTKEGKLLSAQPLELRGAILQGSNGTFKDGPFIETKEVIMGYYHLRADTLQEIVEMAKANPLFEDYAATMEIRPIKHEPGIN